MAAAWLYASPAAMQTAAVDSKAKASIAAATTPQAQLTDLDTFMARVLERRNENWRTLHDYILSEREEFQVLGPGDIVLLGQRRDFSWFIRDGYLVRSPVKANGATLGQDARRKYEADWLDKEKKREQKAKDKAVKKDSVAAEVAKEIASEDPGPEKEITSLVGGEPRFISEAYFMKFPFEPGNYYLAGRESMDGRAVVKIEYYPSRMFNDDRDKKTVEDRTKKPPPKQPPPKKRDKGDDRDEEIQRAMNKVTLVTMWVDPQEFQIVKFTFDNADFGFLPGRTLVRVDDARASMTMGRYFDNVWLPKDLTFRVGATFASGSYRFAYNREFFDYRKGEVSARIRGYVPKEP
jgi:hypothetical protein